VAFLLFLEKPDEVFMISSFHTSAFVFIIPVTFLSVIEFFSLFFAVYSFIKQLLNFKRLWLLDFILQGFFFDLYHYQLLFLNFSKTTLYFIWLSSHFTVV